MSIANVLRGLDKRMSYNLRLIGSVTIQDENIPEKTNKDLADLLKQKTIIERKIKIVPKIKEMQDWT